MRFELEKKFISIREDQCMNVYKKKYFFLVYFFFLFIIIRFFWFFYLKGMIFFFYSILIEFLKFRIQRTNGDFGE